ncbi:MAG: hypothetical protein V1774_02390 [Candidatus Eisenbacteria bacterium]
MMGTDAVEKLILLPPPGQLGLTQLLVPGLILILLLFVGVTMVSLLASLPARSLPRVAEALARLTTRNRAAWVVLGLLPFAILAVLLMQHLSGSALPIGGYLARIGGLFAAAALFTFWYQRARALVAGLMAVMLFAGGSFHLIATLTLLIFPEKWGTLATPVPFLFSIQAIVRFLLFSSSALAMTGASILVAHFVWPDRPRDLTERDLRWLRGAGCGLCLAGALAMPPLLVWNLYTLPAPALAMPVHRAALILVLLPALLAVQVLAMIRGGHTRGATPAFLLALTISIGSVYQGQAAWASAAREQQADLRARAAERLDDLAASREALYESAEPQESLGAEIFNRQCSACHAFDHLIVGPAYDVVVPKYAGNVTGMAAFIQNPRKIDDAFPPMPDLGLRKHEAESVAMYLLHRVMGSAPADSTAPADSIAPSHGEAEP